MIHVLAFARSARKPTAVRQTLEKALLDCILGEALVAKHAVREAVRDAPDPVVELGERLLVAARDECDESLVREMGEVACASTR